MKDQKESQSSTKVIASVGGNVSFQAQKEIQSTTKRLLESSPCPDRQEVIVHLVVRESPRASLRHLAFSRKTPYKLARRWTFLTPVLFHAPLSLLFMLARRRIAQCFDAL